MECLLRNLPQKLKISSSPLITSDITNDIEDVPSNTVHSKHEHKF